MTQKKPSQDEMYGEILTCEQQFLKDIGQLERLSREQEQALLDRVYIGDLDAREEVLTKVMAWGIRCWALRFARTYGWASHRIEYLELLQVGYLAVLEAFDKALQKEAPLAYLNVIAKHTMWHHCKRYASLVLCPDGKEDEAPLVESLDVPLQDGEEWLTYADILEAPVVAPEKSTQEYTPLYDSLAVLTPDQREVIERCYGLGENCCDIPADVNKARRDGTRMGATSAYTMHAKALKKLRTALQSPQQIQASYSMRQACQVLHVTSSSLGMFVEQQHIRKFGRGIYSKDDVDKLARERERLSA